MKTFSTQSFMILTLAALGLAAAACNNVKPPLAARTETYPRLQVQFANESLRDSVVVSEPIVRRDEFGLLHVSVPIRTDTNTALSTEYRVTFLDADGARLSETTWFAKRLTPNVTDEITFNSTSPRVEQFQLSIAYAK